MKAYRFTGENGENVAADAIPANLLVEAEVRREAMLDAVSMFSDDLMEAILEEAVTEDLIHAAVRQGVLRGELTPVYMGSAYKNKGVQLLLDAVTRYLPAPTDIANTAVKVLKGGEEEEFVLSNSVDDPLVCNAFKLEEGPYGQLTYVRVYQGELGKGSDIYNSRTGKKVKVGRMGRMHADEMEEISSAKAGDIIALFGVECASGDTFTGGDRISLSSMHVPEPVVSLAIKPVDNKASDKMSKALNRFCREDPTFHTAVDDETGDTLISGMGELHLEVYLERIKREYGAEVTAGAPQVKYRETITRPVAFDYTHKKQTGGSGQFAKVQGTLTPSEDGEFHFENKVVGGNIPTEYIGGLREGLRLGGGRGPVHRCARAGPEGHPGRRRRPRGGLVGHGLPDRLPHGRAQVLQPGQAGGTGAADARLRRGPRRVPGRHHQDPDATPRRHRRYLPRTRASSASTPMFPWPRCSAMLRCCARRPRARPSSPWSSPAMPRRRTRWPRRWSSSIWRRRPRAGSRPRLDTEQVRTTCLKKSLIERSPVRIFDRAIGGGLGAGKIGVVMSRTGVGKTGFLIGLAIDHLLQDKKVLYISTKESVEHINAFFDQIFRAMAEALDMNEVPPAPAHDGAQPAHPGLQSRRLQPGEAGALGGLPQRGGGLRTGHGDHGRDAALREHRAVGDRRHQEAGR